MSDINYILTSDGTFMSDNELRHYGIKGMRWGVRRYQNEDGTLTAAGRKRVSKQYKKVADRVANKFRNSYNKQYVDSYNEAADYMNREGIQKFNESQRKKYGDDYAKRQGYTDDYYKEFNKRLAQNFNKKTNEFYATDPDVKKARDLVKKYGMTSWDELAKSNEAAIDEVRSAVEKVYKKDHANKIDI